MTLSNKTILRFKPFLTQFLKNPRFRKKFCSRTHQEEIILTLFVQSWMKLRKKRNENSITNYSWQGTERTCHAEQRYVFIFFKRQNKLIRNSPSFHRNDFGAGGEKFFFERNLHTTGNSCFQKLQNASRFVARKTSYLLFFKVLHAGKACVVQSVVQWLGIVALHPQWQLLTK